MTLLAQIKSLQNELAELGREIRVELASQLLHESSITNNKFVKSKKEFMESGKKKHLDFLIDSLHVSNISLEPNY